MQVPKILFQLSHFPPEMLVKEQWVENFDDSTPDTKINL